MFRPLMRAFGSRQAQARPQDEVDERLAMLSHNLAEVEKKLGEKADEMDVEAHGQNGPTVSGPSTRTVVHFPGDRSEIVVVIGTSRDIDKPGLVDRISSIVHTAYTSVGKHKSVDRYDAVDRLEMGDAGPRSNRVLHLAYIGEELVGCASSTYDPGWTPEGCGHWGLLAVDPKAQGKGVATALVLAAERRLAMVSEMIQIEYQYTEGEEFSRRLMAWYEGRLGFDGGPRPSRPGMSSFRRCLKSIPEEAQCRGQRRRLQEIRLWLMEQIAEVEASQVLTKPSASSVATRAPDVDEDINDGAEDSSSSSID